MGGMGGGRRGGFPGGATFSFGGPGRRGPQKDPPVIHELHCSLEELYTGCTKRMKLERTVQDEQGHTRQVEEILAIEIKPGYKDGTKITFEKRGDERPGVVPGLSSPLFLGVDFVFRCG